MKKLGEDNDTRHLRSLKLIQASGEPLDVLSHFGLDKNWSVVAQKGQRRQSRFDVGSVTWRLSVHVRIHAVCMLALTSTGTCPTAPADVDGSPADLL